MLLRTKITLNFVLMSALIILVGTGYFLSSRYLRQEFSDMEELSFPAMESLTQARELVWSLWGEREDEALVESSFRDLEAVLIAYGRLSNNPEARRLSRNLRRRVLDLQENFDFIDVTEYTEAAYRMNAVLSEAVNGETAALSARSGRATQLLTRFSWVSLILIGTAVLLCLIPGWWLANRISTALGETQRAAEEVARGKLDQRLPEGEDDELTRMAGAFNRMVDTIRQADEEITREVEERIRAEKKAQVAAKAKSDFLAQMSHEFRTPLNGILGYSQLLSMDPGLSPTNKGVVKSLEKSGENLLELINDVLDLSKIEANKMNIQKTRFYLDDFIYSLQQSVEEEVKRKGLEFKLNLNVNLPEDVLADPIRLRQILINLLGNAYKFTDRGHIGLAVTPVESGIRFAVFDTGLGIPEDQFADILQPFRQVERKGRTNQGTGLGLPISNWLLEVMGSRLAIKSKVGEGSTFWFDLPQPDLKSRRLVQSPSRITGYRGDTKRLLVGESGHEVTGTLIPLLRKVGFEAIQIEAPEEFVEKSLLFQPDAILLDLYFAGGSGVETLKELEKAYLGKGDQDPPPLLMFSDHRGADDRERSLRSGAAVYLGTPIRFADLLAALKDQLVLTWGEPPGDGDAGSDVSLLKAPELPETLPGEEALVSLLELVRGGNTRQVRIRLEEIKRKEPDASAFLDRMLALSATYRMNDIQRELEDQLEPTDSETL